MNLPKPFLTDQHRHKEKLVVAVVFLLVILFGFLEGWLFRRESDLPVFGNILLFALININVILLLLLSYLVLRNIVKLLFERRRNILGHRLRTRLVLGFVGLALIPTVPLFWLATQFIFSSLDYWFSHKVEHSLEQSVSLAKNYLEQEGRELVVDCQLLKAKLLDMAEKGEVPGLTPSGSSTAGDGQQALEQRVLADASLFGRRQASDPDGATPPTDRTAVPDHAVDKSAAQSPPLAGSPHHLIPLLTQHRLDGLYFFDPKGNLLWKIQTKKASRVDLDVIRELVAHRSDAAPVVQTLSLNRRQEGLITLVELSLPEKAGSFAQPVVGDLVALRFLSSRMIERLAAITSGYEDYSQLKLLHNPFKRSHFITFSIVTLLVVFGAVWFGFLLAKHITVPIQDMVAATQRIAEGDLSVQLDTELQDEIGMLIVSFNKMVRDLKEGREQLANAYTALQQSHTELEDRRRYIEIVMRNIAAGVVSVDESGRIMTMNKSAEAAFGLKAEETRGQPYSNFLQPAHMEIVKSFMAAYRMSRQPNLEQQVQVMMGNRPMVLLIKVSVLSDENDRYMGVVVVLDDLTELEKAQRMAAWREVARRIAHEIKNPLTPIQLCAQRLRRKHAALLDAEGSILGECTGTIIEQVEQMKRLVNEFSKFARLPRAQLALCDLAAVVEDSLALYRGTCPHVSFTLEKSPDLPLLKLDKDQFKQVMINLLENALHAMGDEGGAVTIRLFYDPILKIARLECADTGHGVSPEDKLRMFEPYYSKKEKGTGLGLAIVASIVADHNGFVRVRDNQPRGTVIIIELPG